jgi:hypothetical protein
MEAQEIFDTVVKHLMTQRRPAKSSNGKCMYRTFDGLKCAVGVLILDDEYDHEMDDGQVTSVTALIANYLLPQRLIGHGKLLERLQNAHDDDYFVDRETGFFDFERLGDEIESIAIEFNLNFKKEDFFFDTVVRQKEVR